MAGYGYLNIGYTGYTDDRNKKTYGESGYFDPASRPTIVEAEGRKSPIVSYSLNPGSESYITTSTDRTLEYGRPPMEPVKDYGYTDNKWRNHPYSGEYDNYGRNEPPAMINQGGGLGQIFGPRFDGGEGQMYEKSEPKYPSPTIFEAERRKKPTSPPMKPKWPSPTSDDKWRRRWPPSGHRP